MIARRLFLLGVVGVTAACAPGMRVTRTGLAPNSRLIIYRHADRDDEVLSPLGHRRAAAFVEALDGIPIDAIHTLAIERNLQTAAPLALARGLSVQTLPPAGLARRLARSAAGRSVVWVGNTHNLLALWPGLDLPGDPPLSYGVLVIVTTDSAGEVHLARHMVAPHPS